MIDRAQALPTPSAVELMASLLLGADEGAPPFPAPRGVTPRAALEEAILPALTRPPCFVSFSGGRDSSAILATAVDTARRHGLAEPIPATMRFQGMPATDETRWQTLVLEHLGISERAVIDLRDELDAVGPVATSVVRQIGVRWPGNAYMHVPVLELARGGSLLTGVGGDELFDTRATQFLLVALRRERFHPRDVVSAAWAAMPRRARAAAWRRRRSPEHPWLTPAGVAMVDRALAADAVAWPHRWDASVRHWFRSRAHAAVHRTLPAIAEQYDVMVMNPFVAPGVLAELSRLGGASGFPSRGDAMRQLFADVLPDETLTRRTKAVFSGPVWGPATRAFAEGWHGAGVDGRYVDVTRLRQEWLSPEPNFRTVLLLHAAWLASQPSTSSN